MDECDITLRELNKIKAAFIHILMGIHHLRIEYPGSDKPGEKSKAGKRTKKAKETKRDLMPEKDESVNTESADLNKKSNHEQFEQVHKPNNSGEEKKD